MAHFARLDENNIVQEVLVIANDVPTADGPLGENDMHVDGETYCTNLLGGTWKQTSYNDSFRGTYASAGDTYDAVKDKFIKLQPYPSWVLDDKDLWTSPVAYPSITTFTGDGIEPYNIEWDEDNVRWRGYNGTNWNYWDPDTSTWIAIP
jgi:hypothetical protein